MPQSNPLPSRRQLLAGIGSLSLSGCLWLPNENMDIIPVVFRNNHDQHHRIWVWVFVQGTSEFEHRTRVNPTSSKRYPRAINIGNKTFGIKVAVTVDAGAPTEQSTHVEYEGFHPDDVVTGVNRDGSIFVDPTPSPL